MSQSASQAAIFYRDVEASGTVWTIRDKNGYPAPKNREGIRSMPFWSSKSRIEKIIKNVPAYNGFEPTEINLQEFSNWLKKLKKNKQLVGINWSGSRAIGYDLNPDKLIRWIEDLKPPPKNWINILFKNKN